MNTVYFSVELSVVLTLFAAAMWGSWMQIINHLDDYPISGVVFWLYTFSLLLVVGVTLIFSPVLIQGDVVFIITENFKSILKIMLGGALMSLGLYVNLTIIGSIGLVLSTTVGGGIGTLLGLATAVMIEGMPGGASAGLFLLLTALVFILAGFLSSYASHSRDREEGIHKHQSAVTGKMLLLMLLSALLTNGWAMGTSEGTAAGLPPVLTVVFMATGSFLSVAIACSIEFTIKKRWRQVFCIGGSKKPIILCALSAVCHYGGNFISIYSMPAISAAISFLLGKSSSLWTIFWGLFYKEFSGVSRKTRRFLQASIVLYLVGIVALAVFKVN